MESFFCTDEETESGEVEGPAQGHPDCSRQGSECISVFMFSSDVCGDFSLSLFRLAPPFLLLF